MLRLNQYFLPFLEEIPAQAYEGSYDDRLVVLSLAIASLSAFVALSVSGRIVAASTIRGRLVWAAAGAVSMGGGIWAMHFIGMLAFTLPCGVGYDPIETVLSMVPGILASGAALSVISRASAPSVSRLFGGALLMGGGIGTMHYSGMAAMRPEALLVYDVWMVGVSVIVAVVLAFISLSIRFRLQAVLASTRPATLIAATIMGFAVSGMHYTAMYAATFYYHPPAVLSGLHMPPTFLALLIAVFAVLIASATLAASYAGRQIDLVGRLSSEMWQRAELERDAQRSRARTQAIVDAVADAIVTIDRRGRIRQWSRGAERIFGYSAEEIIGADLTVLMPTPHRAQHDNYVESFIKTRDAKIIGIGRELTAIRKDGSEFPIDLTVSEVQGIDEVLFTGILRDITERKRAEQELIDARQQAEAASQAKSEFLATMSHEIRTPMNGVLGMANLLASTTLSERQSRLTENLLRSGQALMGVINDILDFSKIEAGRLELLEADFEPREVIAEVAELFSERCASKGLEFIYFVDDAVPASLRGDPVRLRQICMNLLGNAIKFTERGEIMVEVSAKEADADQVILEVAVVDTGIGIPADKQATIFESFHQIDSSMTRARGGSGLGLAIVKQLVELMGGQIRVESEVNRGSRFSFTARLRKTAGEIASPRGARQLPRRLSVLLVDAHAASANNISQYLSRWGVEAAVHTTIADAAAAHGEMVAMSRAFDVAIIDVKGLGTVGTAFASMLRGNTSPHPTEIIFLTSVDTFMGEEGKDRAAFATLAKPVRPSELFDCLASIAAGTEKRHVSPLFTRQAAQAKRPRFDARVLVAEDNSVNQEVMVGMLDSIGCRTVTVTNGRAAVQAFTQESFNLILMDCEMPEMDGFEAAMRIRQTESAMNQRPGNRASSRRIPIIAVTAHALPEMRDKCTRAGMDDFLTKPFDDLQLTEALRRHLERQTPEVNTSAGAATASSATAGDAGTLDLVDSAVIRQIRTIEERGSKGLLKRVVTKFVVSAAAAAAGIRSKFLAGDGDGLWRAAHALKSSASAVGAVRVSARCGEIEVTARTHGAAVVTNLLDMLDAEIAATVQSLQSVIDDDDATLH